MTRQTTEHGGSKVKMDAGQWTADTSASKKETLQSGSAVDTGETWKRTKYCTHTIYTTEAAQGKTHVNTVYTQTCTLNKLT